jgi:hypothetical protein
MHGWTGISVSGYLVLDEGQQTIIIPNPIPTIKIHSINFEIEFDAIEGVAYQLQGIFVNGKIKLITESSNSKKYYRVIVK